MEDYYYIAKKVVKGEIVELVLKIEDLDINNIEDKMDLADNPNAKRVLRLILKKNLISKEKYFSLYDDFKTMGSSTFMPNDYIFENGTFTY